MTKPIPTLEMNNGMVKNCHYILDNELSIEMYEGNRMHWFNKGNEQKGGIATFNKKMNTEKERYWHMVDYYTDTVAGQTPIYIDDFCLGYKGTQIKPKLRLPESYYSIKQYADEKKSSVKDNTNTQPVLIRNTGRCDLNFGDICWILKLSNSKPLY